MSATLDPAQTLEAGQRCARAAGLVHVTDMAAGIRRRRAGPGFSYRMPNGEKVTDAATLERIRALAISPAYTDVWICLKPQGHLQATARDGRNRKQYRYHPQWQSARGADKFARIVAFAQAAWRRPRSASATMPTRANGSYGKRARRTRRSSG